MIELHCHLDGIVDPEMLRLLEARGEVLAVTAGELAAAYPVHDLESFIGWFDVAGRLEGEFARV